MIHNIVEQTIAKTLVSALECQLPWGDTIDKLVDHSCKLAHASK